MCAPIALFVFNRLQHTQQTVEALKKNQLANDSDLIIFSDSPKTVTQEKDVVGVRQYIQSIEGFKSVTIYERPVNFGLANSIIDGVTKVINQYGRVIVLEDDLVTSPFFLKYMNDGLNLYFKNERVASIHAYVYPIEGLPKTFFLRGADCWGWATWSNRWSTFEKDSTHLLKELKRQKLMKRFDFNGAHAFTKMLKNQISGKNNSWAIRWHASTFLENKYTLYPSVSLVMNIGNDGTGIHSRMTDEFSVLLTNTPIDLKTIPVEDNKQAYAGFEHFFRQNALTPFKRVVAKIKSLRLRFSP